jgi:hypothetical protein
LDGTKTEAGLTFGIQNKWINGFKTLVEVGERLTKGMNNRERITKGMKNRERLTKGMIRNRPNEAAMAQRMAQLLNPFHAQFCLAKPLFYSVECPW